MNRTFVVSNSQELHKLMEVMPLKAHWFSSNNPSEIPYALELASYPLLIMLTNDTLQYCSCSFGKGKHCPFRCHGVTEPEKVLPYIRTQKLERLKNGKV